MNATGTPTNVDGSTRNDETDPISETLLRVLLGIAVGVIVILLGIIIYLVCRQRRRRRQDQDNGVQYRRPKLGEDDPESDRPNRGQSNPYVASEEIHPRREVVSMALPGGGGGIVPTVTPATDPGRMPNRDPNANIANYLELVNEEDEPYVQPTGSSRSPQDSMELNKNINRLLRLLEAMNPGRATNFEDDYLTPISEAVLEPHIYEQVWKAPLWSSNMGVMNHRGPMLSSAQTADTSGQGEDNTAVPDMTLEEFDTFILSTEGFVVDPEHAQTIHDTQQETGATQTADKNDGSPSQTDTNSEANLAEKGTSPTESDTGTLKTPQTDGTGSETTEM